MHVLRKSTSLLATGFMVAILVAVLVYVLTANRTIRLASPSSPRLPTAAKPVSPALVAPLETAPVRATPSPALTPSPEPSEAPQDEPVYTVNDDDKMGAKLLRLLLDDPHLRMDPDQRSLFLGAVLRAQRRYEAEMAQIFDQDDLSNLDRLDRDAAKRVGAELRQELSAFLTPQQMSVLGGLVGLDTFIRGFFRSQAIVAEGRR